MLCMLCFVDWHHLGFFLNFFNGSFIFLSFKKKIVVDPRVQLMASYRERFDVGTFGDRDLCHFVVNIYDEGNGMMSNFLPSPPLFGVLFCFLIFVILYVLF